MFVVGCWTPKRYLILQDLLRFSVETIQPVAVLSVHRETERAGATATVAGSMRLVLPLEVTFSLSKR